MKPPKEDLLVQTSVRRHPIENLLVQFSVLSFAIMVILAIVLSVILTTRLNRDFEILKEQAAAIEAGAPASETLLIDNLDTDLNLLRWTVYVSVGGGFAILYAGLIWVVWRGWRTIKDQETDILNANTDLRAAYQELQEAQDKLLRTERLAAIGKLSAGVAHDLRNPLGAIKNAAYYINRKLRDSDMLAENQRARQFLEIMDEEIETSNQILTDLMDFARVNTPDRSATRLEPVVDGARERAVNNVGIEVRKDFEEPLPEVQADGEQLRRAFGNLLKNAEDAMPDGGTLTISGRAADGYVELRFADTGQGISETDLGRVLDPLFTTKARGIGLGLAIVKTIVERHEGTIDVESEQGAGTTLTVRLPRADDGAEKKDDVNGT